MNDVVIDTNVLMVADQRHPDISPACVLACIGHLRQAQQRHVIVVDDGYRIFGEYQRKLSLEHGNDVGSAFLKWLSQNLTNPKHVRQVPLTETAADRFNEFPNCTLEAQFDRADRKFAAVANAHPAKPPIWQAADSKWLDWWQALAAVGIHVKFLCPNDICKFYHRKFPAKPLPPLP